MLENAKKALNTAVFGGWTVKFLYLCAQNIKNKLK